ncbi:endonuclease domain-containing protein [Corynebacterium belfantii]|uniref:endonuclease domain-containing protein n=1 Tax=Corynebacterium belfantii TaxID=2014537 RepID=UPI0035311EDD
MERAGVRVTNPARTCLDIARLHGFAEGLVAVDSALRAGLVSVEDLKETRAAMARMKGPIPMKMAVEHAYAGSESPYESLLRALIIERIPAATVYPQFRVLGKYRADLCIDGWLIIEVDGDTKYDGTYGTAPETVVKEQMRRQREIENQQFTVLRFGPKELVNDPNSVVETIYEYLDRKAGKVA